jgi:hypothetical protein
MMYLLYALGAMGVMQLLLFIVQVRVLSGLRKRNRASEIDMSTLRQWIISNDKSIMDNLAGMRELLHALYARTRMIDLSFRNRTSADKPLHGQELRELEALLCKEQWSTTLIKESTHKDAVEKIRSEDIHFYYTTLIEELQHLNKQISRSVPRGEAITGTGNTPANKNELNVASNGWYSRNNGV